MCSAHCSTYTPPTILVHGLTNRVYFIEYPHREDLKFYLCFRLATLFIIIFINCNTRWGLQIHIVFFKHHRHPHQSRSRLT